MLKQLKIITNDAGNDTCIHNIPPDSTIELIFSNNTTMKLHVGNIGIYLKAEKG